MLRPPPRHTLFPYTTLFRSRKSSQQLVRLICRLGGQADPRPGREGRRHLSSSSWRLSMRVKPWEAPDGLWQRIEPLLPKKQRRFRYPGRKPLDDRKVLQGILFVLHTGIGWEHLLQEPEIGRAHV